MDLKDSQKRRDDSKKRLDVVVVGAGIIGLVNALQIAKRGLKVTLIDNYVGQKRSFKVGESLLIFSNMFLRTVGGLDDFLKTSFPKEGVWFTYGMEGKTSFDGRAEWAIVSTAPDDVRAAYKDQRLARAMLDDGQIVRPEAEDALAEQARQHPNITFMDTSMARDIRIDDLNGDHEVDWVCKATGKTGTVITRWVVDCSGRNRMLAKRRKHAVEDRYLADGFKTTAVWGQFDGITDELFERFTHAWPEGKKTRRDLNTLHLWGDGYWIWVIRLSNNRISVGATYDQRVAPAGKTYKAQFWDIMRRYPLFDEVLRDDNMLEFRSYKQCQLMTDTFISPKRYGMVGDAAAVIDAYYSQGMSLNFVTSWHLANVIEKDLLKGTLDEDYCKRVNELHFHDWLFMRNVVASKYTTAVQDGRFFFLSHVADMVIFGGIANARYQLARWLVGTQGDPKQETEQLADLRSELEHSLFYTAGFPWKQLGPSRAERLQRHIQMKLGERAQWRVAHGVEVAPIRCLMRPLNAGLFPFWKLPFSRSKWLDISPKPMAKTPSFLRLTGEEKSIIGMRLAPVIMTIILFWLYSYDVIDTAIAKMLVALGLAGRRTAPAALPEAPAKSEPSVPVPARSGTRLVGEIVAKKTSSSRLEIAVGDPRS